MQERKPQVSRRDKSVGVEPPVDLTIGAVARATGIPANTLRTWERRYGFPRPARTEGGHRLFSAQTVEHLRLISRALEQGHRPRQVVGAPLEVLRRLAGGVRTASPAPAGAVVSSWLDATRRMDAPTLVGAFHAAWKDEDLGGVRRRCLGLDFDALAPHIDVFSPMVYHRRSGKPPEYVKAFVEYMSARPWIRTDAHPQFWPIVQAHDEPRISPEEFEQVLRYGLGGKSTGVMMFTIRSVAQDPGKMAAMKRVYREYSR